MTMSEVLPTPVRERVVMALLDVVEDLDGCGHVKLIIGVGRDEVRVTWIEGDGG